MHPSPTPRALEFCVDDDALTNALEAARARGISQKFCFHVQASSPDPNTGISEITRSSANGRAVQCTNPSFIVQGGGGRVLHVKAAEMI